MAPPQHRYGVLADVALRISIPRGKSSGSRQEYQISFRDEAMLGQAMESLESAADLSPVDIPDGSRADDRKNSVRSGWLCPPEDAALDDSPQAQIERDRQETLDILEGLRPQRKYYDWQGCRNEPYFNHRAILEAKMKAGVKPIKLGLGHHAQPEGGSPAFSWEDLHRIIVDQLSEDDRAHFPAWQAGMVATLLFMGSEDEDGVQRVMNAFALHEHTVFEFRMLMLDVAVRGRRDVLWLSYPGETLPLGSRNGGAIEMRWGEQMI